MIYYKYLDLSIILNHLIHWGLQTWIFRFILVVFLFFFFLEPKQDLILPLRLINLLNSPFSVAHQLYRHNN